MPLLESSCLSLLDILSVMADFWKLLDLSKATDNESDIFDADEVREIFEEIVEDRSPDGLLNPLSDLLEKISEFSKLGVLGFWQKVLSRAARVDGSEWEDSICKFAFLYFPIFVFSNLLK